MDDSVFEHYFNKCVWRGDDKVLSNGELKDMENACLDKLLELKKHDYQQYKFLFVKYGKKVVERISFLDDKKYKDGIEEVMPLRVSYVRFLDNLKNLDRSLYEHSLRRAINKGKQHHESSKSVATKETPKEDKPIEKMDEQVPHFTNLKIDEQKVAVLYDRYQLGEKGEPDRLPLFLTS